MKRVAIVERELVAGECSFWACMPSKTLLRPGETVAAARRAWGARRAVTGELDVAESLEWRNEVVSNWDDSGYLPWLEERGIELIRGTGRIAGPGKVDVDGTEYETERIVIATGSAPAFPPVDGLEGPRRPLDQPPGHGNEGSADERADPGRRTGGGGDEPGADPVRG